MAALTAVVTALSVGLAINFLLTLAVLRRLRIQASESRPRADVGLPEVGVAAPEFAIETIEGQQIDSGSYENGAFILGFFAQDCQACERVKAEIDRTPPKDPFVALVRAPLPHQAKGGRLVEDLVDAGASVAVFDPSDNLMERFSIQLFPTLLRIEHGVIVAAGLRLKDVAAQSTTRTRRTKSERKYLAGVDSVARR